MAAGVPLATRRRSIAAATPSTAPTAPLTRSAAPPTPPTNAEGPIHDAGGVAPWSGTYGTFTFSPTATFEETLTGQIYIGSDPNPPLGQITTSGETGGGTSDTGDVPEPAGWWLMGAALPLIAV